MTNSDFISLIKDFFSFLPYLTIHLERMYNNCFSKNKTALRSRLHNTYECNLIILCQTSAKYKSTICTAKVKSFRLLC